MLFLTLHNFKILILSVSNLFYTLRQTFQLTKILVALTAELNRISNDNFTSKQFQNALLIRQNLSVSP